jgi:hypothetical protein
LYFIKPFTKVPVKRLSSVLYFFKHVTKVSENIILMKPL